MPALARPLVVPEGVTTEDAFSDLQAPSVTTPQQSINFSMQAGYYTYPRWINFSLVTDATAGNRIPILQAHDASGARLFLYAASGVVEPSTNYSFFFSVEFTAGYKIPSGGVNVNGTIVTPMPSVMLGPQAALNFSLLSSAVVGPADTIVQPVFYADLFPWGGTELAQAIHSVVPLVP